MMRMMAVSNVLCRRENEFIYIPVDPSADGCREAMAGLVGRAYRVAKGQGVM